MSTLSKQEDAASSAVVDACMGEQETAVWLALRLGWLASEVVGLARKGAFDKLSARPKRNVYRQTGRLTISDGIQKDDEPIRLQASLALLLHHAEALGVFSPGDMASPLSQLHHELTAYYDAYDVVPVPTVARVRLHLERWSMDAWGKLNSANPLLARAFTYGASIADTFYFMRVPGKAPPKSDRETWKRLLDDRRLRAEGERVAEIADYLPSNLGESLKHSLLAWRVAAQIRKSYANERGEIPLDIEVLVYRKLQSQSRIWRSLILGEKRPKDYILPGVLSCQRFWAIVLTLIGALLLVGALVTVVLLITLPAISVAASLVTSFLDWARTTEDNPTMDIVGLVVTSLPMLAALTGFLFVTGRWLFVQVLELHEFLERWLVLRQVKKRITVAWDRDLEGLGE